jgi:hypothetical protein
MNNTLQSKLFVPDDTYVPDSSLMDLTEEKMLNDKVFRNAGPEEDELEDFFALDRKTERLEE